MIIIIFCCIMIGAASNVQNQEILSEVLKTSLPGEPG